MSASAATRRAQGWEFEGSIWRTIFDRLPVPALLLDEQLRVLAACGAASTLFGLAQEQWIGLPVLSVLKQPRLAGLLVDLEERKEKVLEIETTAMADRRSRTLRVTAMALEATALAPKEHGLAKRESRIRRLKLLLFEDITEKAALERQVVHAEKMAGMGQLAAGIAHEIANPLTSMASNLLFLREQLPASAPASVAQALDATLQSADDMQQLLLTLSGFVRRRAPKFEPSDLHELIRGSAAFVSKDAEKRQIQLKVSLAPFALICELDPRMIRQVLLNLLKNAMESMPQGGRIEVTTKWQPAPGGDGLAAVVEISDNGVGLDETELQKVFRPLYSTKPHGMGLGLSSCRQIVGEHNGEIHLVSRKGSGTTVTMVLPLRRESDSVNEPT